MLILTFQCFTFALKIFKDGNQEIFSRERAAFRQIQWSDNLTKCFCAYSQEKGGHTKSETHHLLLEFGASSLSDFLSNRPCPTSDKERALFWSNLFHIADAIKDIHELNSTENGNFITHRGWHADIKPDNILDIRGKFKLSDLGFAKLEESSNMVDKKHMSSYHGGTITYGAPECYIYSHQAKHDRDTNISQSIDIWSLGCVFSLTATWMICGNQGLETFEKQRESAIKKIVEGSWPLPHPIPVDLELGDYFHNGQEMLDAVKDWHQHLRAVGKNSDRITSRVLDLVDDHMMKGKPAERIPAQEVCLRLGAICNAAHEAESDEMIVSIEE